MANIKLSKEQQQYLALAVLFLGGGGFAYVQYFWRPTSKKITEVKVELKKVKKDIQEAKLARANLKKINRTLKELKAKMKALTKTLPREKDVPGVIDKLIALTKKHNIAIHSVSPGGEQKQQGFVEVYYNIKITATYHQLGEFLAALALEERLFRAKGINFGSRDSEGKMSLRFKIVAYQYAE